MMERNAGSVSWLGGGAESKRAEVGKKRRRGAGSRLERGAGSKRVPHSATFCRSGTGHKKPAALKGGGWVGGRGESCLGLLDEAGFDGLDRDPEAFDGAVGEFHADALQVRTELALRDARHVRADAAAFFSDTFAVDVVALGGTFASDSADSGHDVSWVEKPRT